MKLLINLEKRSNTLTPLIKYDEDYRLRDWLMVESNSYWPASELDGRAEEVDVFIETGEYPYADKDFNPMIIDLDDDEIEDYT